MTLEVIVGKILNETEVSNEMVCLRVHLASHFGCVVKHSRQNEDFDYREGLSLRWLIDLVSGKGDVSVWDLSHESDHDRPNHTVIRQTVDKCDRPWPKMPK